MTYSVGPELNYMDGLKDGRAESSAEIERLRADKDVQRSQERNTSYEASIAELEADNERMRTALKPFALAVDPGEYVRDHEAVKTYVLAGDLRRARAAHGDEQSARGED
jgi:hypothetical protein